MQCRHNAETLRIAQQRTHTRSAKSSCSNVHRRSTVQLKCSAAVPGGCSAGSPVCAHWAPPPCAPPSCSGSLVLRMYALPDLTWKGGGGDGAGTLLTTAGGGALAVHECHELMKRLDLDGSVVGELRPERGRGRGRSVASRAAGGGALAVHRVPRAHGASGRPALK